MSPLRRFASRLLDAAAGCTSRERRDWAVGMRRELDAIDSDWRRAAWALGCTTTLLTWALRRRCAAAGCSLLDRYRRGGLFQKSIDALAGLGFVAFVGACAFGGAWVAFAFFPGFAERARWFPAVALIVLPTLPLAGGVATTWRKRRSLAVGILVSTIALGTHAAFHTAMHFID